MINYETTLRKNKNSLDKSKKNILLIGKGTKNEKAKIILNPINIANARKIYGDSQLYEAYKYAREITNDDNVYTVNCPLFTDFIEIIDSLVQYNFDFIVPIDIYLQDTFINPVTDKLTYFGAYYLERLGMTENQSIVIMTDRQSSLYNDIDVYIEDMNNIVTKFNNDNSEIVSLYGNNMVFVLNNLIDNVYSHVILAASLAACDFKTYPVNIKDHTYFDIDHEDINNNSICFYKYHPISNYSSIEQLLNFRPLDDIYKKVLIDILVKYVVKQLDLSEFNGTLYNPYVKVRIDTKVSKIMSEMKNKVFQDFKIKSIAFEKVDIGVGNIIIDVSITPFSLLEKINILLEV
jgi:hypothetical protein